MTAPPRPSLIPIDRIVGMLTDRIEALARELLPLGRRDGPEWREASTARGGLGDALAVHIAPGPRRGVWKHFGSGESGDALDLIVYIKGFRSKAEGIAWAKAWLGLDGSNPEALREAGAVRMPRRSDARSDDDSAQRRRASAHSIYLAGQPIEGTPVERYLAGRGLPVARHGWPLRALRFHPQLWDRHTKRQWPAMVAAVTGHDGTFLAVHMTYLQIVSRDGPVRKAPIVDEAGKVANKRVLGSCRGGAIRLWRGTTTDPLTGEIKQARRLAHCKGGVWIDLTEGIEDGLSVAMADAEARVWCGLNVSNLATIRMPACVQGVVLWRQNDAPNSPADAGADKVMAWFTGLGKQVAVARMPDGIKDINELVQLDATVTGEQAVNE